MESKTIKAFRHWMQRMNFSRRRAAEILDMHPNTIGGYNTGRRGDGEPVEVPKHVLLACAAVENELLPIRPTRGED